MMVGGWFFRAFMTDLCCRRFVLTVLADTADLLPIQKMSDQVHRINSLGPSVVREFDFHHVSTEDKTKQRISWQKLQGLHVTKKQNF